MIQSKRNEVGKALVALGEDPNHYRWNAKKDGLDYVGPGSERELPGTFYIRFDTDQSCFYSPGKTVRVDHFAWDFDLETEVGKWITELRRELAVPDLWADFSKLRAEVVNVGGMSSDAAAEHAPIGDLERERLFEAIEEVKALVEANKDASDAERAEMKNVLDTVKSASGIVSRKFLVETILGTVIKKGLDSALTGAHVQWLWLTLVHAMNALRVFGETAVRALLDP